MHAVSRALCPTSDRYDHHRLDRETGLGISGSLRRSGLLDRRDPLPSHHHVLRAGDRAQGADQRQALRPYHLWRLSPGLCSFKRPSTTRSSALPSTSLARTILYKTNFSPELDGRAVEKSRENRSSGSHQRPRGDARHGCHEVLARVSGKGTPISGTKVTWLAPNVLLATVLPPHAPRPTPHDRRGPPSMPRAELGTALPTRQGVNMLRKATIYVSDRSSWSLVFGAS